MEKILKELKGYSGSKLLLLQNNDQFFVRKSGNVIRNLERYNALSKISLNLPKILRISLLEDTYDMEYIPNLDIKNFLSIHSAHELADFLKNAIEKLMASTYSKDFTDTYYRKLECVDFEKLPFSMEELISKLPRILPASEYHGDLTLENILYNVSKHHFVLIDPLRSEYNSYVFDMSKLRQDLTCKWFVRNDEVYFNSKLQLISDRLNEIEHFENDYLLILMLLRVMPYAKNNTDEDFLISEIKKLWK